MVFYNNNITSVLSNDKRFIMIHFRNVKEVLDILRDVYTYIAITQKNDALANKIMRRIDVILKDNDTKLTGDDNENKRNSEN